MTARSDSVAIREPGLLMALLRLRPAGRAQLAIGLAAIASLHLSPASLAAGFSDYIKAGERAYRSGNRADAERNLLLAVKAAEKSDANGAEVAEALTDLGVIYDETHRYAEAESAYKRSLAIREKRYGPDDMAVATTVNNLANLYKDQKRYAEAERLYKRSIDVGLKLEGPDSGFLAMSYYNLSSLYQLQGRWGDSIPLLRRAMQISEKTGDHHLMDIVGKLGLACEKDGKSSDAAPLFVRYFEMAAKILGMDAGDPKTVAALKDFARNERQHDNAPVAELTEKAIEYFSKAKR